VKERGGERERERERETRISIYIQESLTEGGRLSTIDLVLTRFEKLLLIMQTSFVLHKTSYLYVEVNCKKKSSLSVSIS
jgi:hypothetical protein